MKRQFVDSIETLDEDGLRVVIFKWRVRKAATVGGSADSGRFRIILRTEEGLRVEACDDAGRRFYIPVTGQLLTRPD